MAESRLSIAELLRQDKRYKIEAYAFVFEALRFGHEALGMGTARKESMASVDPGASSKEAQPERHLTGQELCEAIRQYALEQYGYMARSVLESWGVRTTGDFGEIVFNLIRVGEMRKTESDRREDFENVFDFETGLCERFEIKPPVERPKPPTS
ncbi:MAG TPA: Minf_1886 family protein [Pirellulales bacterium]|jgi:uncharacterized repeat protein (TIGR04138 family)|nr:Minf_1886 family protein [Pirellulales bacterium]